MENIYVLFAVNKLIVDPGDGAIKLNSIANDWSDGEYWFMSTS